MTESIVTAHNRLEPLVFQAVQYYRAQYPDISHLLADVACIALNHLPARYIRHRIDFAFFNPYATQVHDGEAIKQAVLAAFDYVYMRNATGSRAALKNIHVEVEHDACSTIDLDRIASSQR
jgi:Late competence development protein ComFB